MVAFKGCVRTKWVKLNVLPMVAVLWVWTPSVTVEVLEDNAVEMLGGQS